MCQYSKYGSKRIDPCIREFIKTLNLLGMKCIGSCCGHKKYKLTVIVEKEDGTRMDLISGIEIPRRVKSYKKDSEGRYYIPEVENA